MKRNQRKLGLYDETESFSCLVNIITLMIGCQPQTDYEGDLILG